VPVHNHFIASPTSGGRPDAGALVALGAFVTMDVAVPPAIAATLTASGQAVPPSASGCALVDTGATITCVHEPLLIALGLQPVDKVASGTAAGPVQQSIYMARISFPLLSWSLDLPVAGVDLVGQAIATAPPQPVIALLGRNLLSNCVVIWNGPGGYWTIAS
jgi:hypothetical protein